MISRLAGETDEAFVLRVEGAARRPGESDKDYAQRLSGSAPPLDPWRIIIEGAGPAEHVIEGNPPTLPARLAGEADEAYVTRVRAARAELVLVQEVGESDADFAKREKAAKAAFPDEGVIGRTAFVDVSEANILFGRFIDLLRARGHKVTSALFYPGPTGENPPVDITDGDLANLRFYRVVLPKSVPAKPKAKKAVKKAAKKR